MKSNYAVFYKLIKFLFTIILRLLNFFVDKMNISNISFTNYTDFFNSNF